MSVRDACYAQIDVSKLHTGQERALLTYVKRTYFPFVLREPQLQSSDGRVAGALWAYADPATAVRAICFSQVTQYNSGHKASGSCLVNPMHIWCPSAFTNTGMRQMTVMWLLRARRSARNTSAPWPLLRVSRSCRPRWTASQHT